MLIPLRRRRKQNYVQHPATAGILQYLIQAHDPRAIIILESYADNSFDETSDFDAWLIGRVPDRARRDMSVVNHVPLHIKIYPPQSYETMGQEGMKLFACAAIAYDPEGLAREFLDRVQESLRRCPCMSPGDKRKKISVMQAMLRRARKQDFDGDHRGHMLLSDSLEAWCDLSDRIYLSTKKALRLMEREDPESAAIYRRALRSFAIEDMQAWVDRLCAVHEANSPREYRRLQTSASHTENAQGAFFVNSGTDARI